MSLRRLIPAVGTAAAAWVFSGGWGLLAAAVVAGVWFLVPMPRRAPWVAAVVLVAATPIAIAIQGLPSGRVPGPGFAEQHLVSHAMVGLALLLLLLATLDELVVGSRGRAEVEEVGPEHQGGTGHGPE